MNDSGGPFPSSERMGLILTLIIAAAAVCTAWAGFQSTKWSGVQANSYAEASAARTEAARYANRAGQQRTVDVLTFAEWLSALNEEMSVDPLAKPGANYEPRDGTISGFLFKRLRLEFRPAMDAWLRTEPFVNPAAPATPFVLPEYNVAADADADRLEKRAEQLGSQARDANQRSDNYVLTAVLFALVLFFAAIADRAHGRRAQLTLFFLAAVGLVATIGVLVTFPIQV